MINLTKSNAATRIARAITRAAQSPVQTILVTDEQAAELAALGQAFRVGDVIITTDPTVEPPAPPPKPPPPPRTLDDAKAQRKGAILGEAEMAVAERFPGNDLLMLLSDSLTFVKLQMQGANLAPHAAVLAELEESTAWVEAVRTAAGDAETAIDEAATVAEADAVPFTLPTPPAKVVRPKDTLKAAKAAKNP